MKKEQISLLALALQMNMPNEQGRFEFAQSLRLHRASVFRRNSQGLVVLQISFAKHVMYISSGCIVSSRKSAGNTNTFFLL
jgi:hypothetical protein